jgi:hypothetical protein
MSKRTADEAAGALAKKPRGTAAANSDDDSDVSTSVTLPKPPVAATVPGAAANSAAAESEDTDGLSVDPADPGGKVDLALCTSVHHTYQHENSLLSLLPGLSQLFCALCLCPIPRRLAPHPSLGAPARHQDGHLHFPVASTRAGAQAYAEAAFHRPTHLGRAPRHGLGRHYCCCARRRRLYGPPPAVAPHVNHHRHANCHGRLHCTFAVFEV